MSDQHRATPEQDRADPQAWKNVVVECIRGSSAAATILELRARVEALEAAQLEKAESHRFCTDAIVRRVEALEAAYEETAMDGLRAASAEAQPAWGLVERVGNRLPLLPDGRVDDKAACAAIREVAAWFRMGDNGAGSAWTVAADVLDAVLKQEADRG
jgi:hypothetical protein